MALVLAYWHKDGLDVYRYMDKKPVKQASGTLDGLKPIRGVLDKKVLIVGRELLLHTRKRYPPAPGEKLVRAVGLEIGDIFPISKPAFHCRVFESSTTHTMLDIWAWESGEYARLREVFPFNYVVPEDLACPSDIPEVKIFHYRGITHILAHSGERFLGGASYTSIGERDVERFLSGLGRHRSDIKRIKVYGPILPHFKDELDILRVPEGDRPPCIDCLGSLNLKEFKVRGDYRLSSKIDLIFRVSIYLILGYALMLYLTAGNYGRVANEIRERINLLEREITTLDAKEKVEDYSEIIQEVNERLSKRSSPLLVLDIMAEGLPPGSFINRTVLNENNLEVSVSSKDPLSVVRALGGAPGIKSARLRGAPVRDGATGSYNFIVIMEISP